MARPDTRPRRRKWQFSLLSVFVMMTLACGGLSWWTWPRKVEVVALILASTTSVSPTGVPMKQPEFVGYQARLLAAFKDPCILGDAVAVAGNGQLAMLRGRRTPVEWIRQRLEVDAAPNSVISVKLTVPERFQRDAIEFVDYVMTRAVTQIAREIQPIPRSKLRELVEQRLRLEQSISATSQRLELLKQTTGTGGPELIPVATRLQTELETWKKLGEQIDACQSANEFVGQVRFVQRAAPRRNT